MRIDCLSVSKYSAPGKPGDDVPVLLPGQCFAVFDGATDVKGTRLHSVAYPFPVGGGVGRSSPTPK